MGIDVWWPRLGEATRAWLIDNNGDVIPEDVIDEIVQAGGTRDAQAWVVTDDGLTLADDLVDWIEAVANGETPDPV